MGFFDISAKEKETEAKHGHTTIFALSNPEVGMKFHEGFSYWVSVVAVNEKGVTVEIYVGTDKRQGDCVVNHFATAEEFVDHYTYSVRLHIPWVYYLGKVASVRHLFYYQQCPVYEHLSENANCPVCHASWRGAVIPSQARNVYGHKKYVCKLSAIESPTPSYERIAYLCPSCGTQWNAKTGELIPKKSTDSNFKAAGL